MQQTEPLKIFIVENHGDTLQMLKLYFEDFGHEVKTAGTVAAAVSDLRSYSPDLILCDIGLPDGTGWELLNRVAHKPRFAVAMSGFGMHADSDRSRKAGFQLHLLKPFKISELDKILAEAAASAKTPPPQQERLENHSPPRSKTQDVVQAIEWERRRLGDRLHDGVCQTLAGTAILIEKIGKAVEAGTPVPPDSFAKLNSMIKNAIDQTRSLSRQFMPLNLQGTGLIIALQDLALTMPNCDFQCDKAIIISDESIALALYRIAEEALSNALTHANAQALHLALIEERDQVVLRVTDNGKGFVPAAAPAKWSGISTMTMRAHEVGGSLKVQSAPGQGTIIQCTVPLRANHE